MLEIERWICNLYTVNIYVCMVLTIYVIFTSTTALFSIGFINIYVLLQVSVVVYSAEYVGKVQGKTAEPKLNLNRSLTYYQYSVPVRQSHHGAKQSWYSVLVNPCGWTNSAGVRSFRYEGAAVTRSRMHLLT
jgi:hypothetical protein